jgi:hypothetical protein
VEVEAGGEHMYYGIGGLVVVIVVLLLLFR